MYTKYGGIIQVSTDADTPPAVNKNQHYQHCNQNAHTFHIWGILCKGRNSRCFALMNDYIIGLNNNNSV